MCFKRGVAYQFIIYEQEPLDINSDYIIHEWKCEEELFVLFCGDDAQITLQLPEIIEGGSFGQNIINSDNQTDSISILIILILKTIISTFSGQILIQLITIQFGDPNMLIIITQILL